MLQSSKALIAIAFVILGASLAKAQEDCPRGQLDKAYCDRDGDMVADTPTDPKKLIDPPTLIFAYSPVEGATANELDGALPDEVREQVAVSTEDGEVVTVSSNDDAARFNDRIRDERKFSGIEELKTQIARDTMRAKLYFRRQGVNNMLEVI